MIIQIVSAFVPVGLLAWHFKRKGVWDKPIDSNDWLLVLSAVIAGGLILFFGRAV